MTRTVEKVTVSLPAELLARIEGRRHSGGLTRSEVISDLLWRGWRQLEDEDREERYRAAYQAQPETDDELAWADIAADQLFTDDHPGIGVPERVIETKPEPIPDTVNVSTGLVKKSTKATKTSGKVTPERRAAR
jgi:hypothetical protein